MGTNRDVVERFLRLSAEVDADAALALCTEDVVYEVVALETYRGREGVRSFLSDQEAIAAVHRVVGRILEAGDEVAVERVDTFVAGVGTIEVPTAAFFTLRGGRICHWIDYQDLRDMARAFGH